jgi:glycosyltransferase involved in cell wall biosynthesis
VRCGFSEDDIFIGHPFFPHELGRYGVTELAAKEARRPRKFALIAPLHCDLAISHKHINKEFLADVDRLMPVTDVLFAIMGDYWWDQWSKSPFAHWKHKMTRLDLAVDVNYFPRVKTRFNKAGRRGYLYIGANEPRKGTDVLSHLMNQLGNYPCGWVGRGPEIPGIKHISPDRPLTPSFMAELANTFDFFVSPSRVDPNPTTILESMAWGFPVICTPQSGYYETSYRSNIFIDNYDRSVAVLQRLQYANGAELLRMASEARAVVETQYSWDRFTSSIVSRLELSQASGIPAS